MRVGTFNIYRGLGKTKREGDLADFLATGVTVAGLQEIDWSLEDVIPEGWEFWQPAGKQQRKDPIVWRDDVWACANYGNERVSDRLENGGRSVPARDLVWAILRHLETDQYVIFANLHSNAGVEQGGHAKDLPRVREYRQGLVNSLAFLDDLQAELSEAGKDAPVVWVGDFNVDYSADRAVQDRAFPYANLTPAGYECCWVLGEQSTRTKGKRTIDHVWVKGSAALVPMFVDVRTPNADIDSDHVPVVLDLEFLPVEPEPETEVPSMDRFVSRDAWGSTGIGATPSTHPIGATKGITAHWEGPGMGNFPHSRCARKVRTIERFHKVNRGWADIAYNAIVCPHGYVFEGRGPNVKSAANGYGSVNDDWYAVCYLGGVGDPFTPEGREGFCWAFAWLTHTGDAGPERNGHRDHKPTACPGDAVYRWVHSPAARATSDYLEDDMPSAKELMEHRITNREKDKDVGDALRKIFALDNKVSRLLAALDVDAIAETVATRLAEKAPARGGLTTTDVKDAVKAALAEGVEE